MIFRLRIIVFIMMLAFPGMVLGADDKSESADPEPVGKLSASLDRKSAHVGDTVVLTLKYALPEGCKFTPESKLEGLDDFAVIDQKAKEGEIKLTLIVDQIDLFEIGPLSLSFIDDEGVTTIIKSEPVALEVLSSLGDKPAEAQLKPIMDIVPITPLWLKYLPWIAGFIILASIIGGIIWWRRKRRREMEEIMRLRPPHVIARDEIQKLQSGMLFEKGQYKEFYFRLSEIMRRYLEKIRSFPAAEFTTEEIARQIKVEVDRKIVPLLREADLVKFADAVPTPARKDEDIRVALAYVKDTSPVSSAEQNENVNSGEKK